MLHVLGCRVHQFSGAYMLLGRRRRGMAAQPRRGGPVLMISIVITDTLNLCEGNGND